MMRIAFVVLLVACSEPPPSTTAPITSASPDGVHVHVGGRDVIVHCALTCDAMATELTRMSNDCVRSPTSGPHRVTTDGPLLTIACCQEAALAYDRGCGHETLAGCAQHWQASCEGVQPREVPSVDEPHGRGLGP